MNYANAPFLADTKTQMQLNRAANMGNISKMVPEEGLEPSHTHVRQILSLLRLPFRHSGKKQMERAKGIEPS